MFTYKKRKSIASATAQTLVIMIILGIIFPILCSVPGISALVSKITIELLGNTFLTDHWLALLSEFSGQVNLGISELIPQWISCIIALSLPAMIESIVLAIFIKLCNFLWKIFDPDGIPIISTVIGTILGLMLVRIIGFGLGIYILAISLGIGLMLFSTRSKFKLRKAIAKEIPSILVNGFAAFFCVGYISTLRFIAESRISKTVAAISIILISLSLILIEISLFTMERRLEKQT